MDDVGELGEFVGKGFALLRERLKAVEARKLPVAIKGDDAVVDYDKIKALIPDPIKGDDAVVDYDRIEEMIPKPIKGDKGEPGKNAVVDYGKIKAMIPAPIKGDDAVVDYERIEEMIPEPIPGKAAVVDYARIRDMIPKPIKGDSAKGDKGDPGNGVKAAKIDKRGHLIITLDDGREIDAGKAKGKDAVQFQGMIAGGPSSGGGGDGTTVLSGVAVLDFGTSNKTASVTVTGLPDILTTSIVTTQMRATATADHPIDDLLVDPIRVTAHSIIAGSGFTIYGQMDNAPANGLYNIQWTSV